MPASDDSGRVGETGSSQTTNGLGVVTSGSYHFTTVSEIDRIPSAPNLNSKTTGCSGSTAKLVILIPLSGAGVFIALTQIFKVLT
ncbi:hypothetical protein CO180_00070 [candidate division WWE3 bacterium CG_4_9_14_3_um_filter_41_6]|uniref:Uncharacterized protein n=1 Tax=candidate division WWE3 bacterium CG_4_10_14_0_2_um_filter_41_14 TaxID=1975072 RepID=A0A2M7TID1_UNCKA|nr:MAG: hypothetical protein COY32_04220 [candidate division WWE3 bacterium CG_4_10_14_0_2_um_filter_41_14]PJA39742.1 MAG: hypothetical protein CO180_00070 [candidate division WWE3 bacterium CG_4_9_14_3_um_filter_41_6]